MPHSPYIQQVDPPISDNDIVTFRHDLQRIRWERDDGIDDKFAIDTTLHSGELLLEQCEFLEAKLTIKKRENFQLATQTEALVRKVTTLELEIGVLKDENRLCKEKLAALKAKLDMEIEVLKKENEIYKTELAAVNATLDDRLSQARKQSSFSDDQARPDNKAEVTDIAAEVAGPDDKAAYADKSAEAAEAEPGKDESLKESTPLTTTLPLCPLKRELEPDPTSDQDQPSKKGRWMVASFKRPDGEGDAT